MSLEKARNERKLVQNQKDPKKKKLYIKNFMLTLQLQKEVVVDTLLG